MRAEAHLESILDYIHKDRPAAAQRVGRAVRTAAEMLRYLPESGRRGRLTEQPILVILGVFHGAQDERKI
jgi:plasmid stabilization system protein ParE